MDRLSCVCFKQMEGWALGLRFVLNVLGRDDCAGN